LKEGKPKREGRNLSCILSPRPEVLKAINDQKRKEEREKKKKREESLKKKQEAEMVGAGAGAAAVSSYINGEASEEHDDILDKIRVEVDDEDEDGDLSSSLDDLLGGDDLTDDLFG
jgi:hypothetical protein